MDEKLMTLPVIALRGLTVLPEMIQHFDISRDKSISAVEHAMVGEQKVFLVTQRQIEAVSYTHLPDHRRRNVFMRAAGALFCLLLLHGALYPGGKSGNEAHGSPAAFQADAGGQ